MDASAMLVIRFNNKHYFWPPYWLADVIVQPLRRRQMTCQHNWSWEIAVWRKISFPHILYRSPADFFWKMFVWKGWDSWNVVRWWLWDVLQRSAYSDMHSDFSTLTLNCFFLYVLFYSCFFVRFFILPSVQHKKKINEHSSLEFILNIRLYLTEL